MFRQWFRIGLRIGLLVGLSLALVRTIRSRRSRTSPGPPAEPWPPLAEDGPSPTVPGAVAAAPPVDEVGEAVLEPPGPAPARDAGPGQPADVEATLDVEPPAPPVPPAQAGTTGATGATGKATGATGKATGATGKATGGRRRAAGATGKATGGRRRAAGKADPEAPASDGPAPAWVEPSGGSCPSTHPVKAKLSSRLFHLPGMAAYARTRADRCYADDAAAAGDGFTRAKR